jgi:BACON domain-containing protein
MQSQVPTVSAFPGGAGSFNSSSPTANVCAACHSGANGSGSATISGLPASYTPGGAAIPVTVTVNDTSFSTWGFQLNARLSSNLNTQGGTFTAGSTSNVSSGAVEGSGGSDSFSFMWTPPTTAAGTVNFYLSGLATSSTSNNDFYSTSATVAQAAAATPDFSLSANPSSVSVAQSASATSTMTVTGSNGFSGAVSYSASGLPSGVTASFSGNTLTLTASSTATVGGPTTVTITGTSGTLSHTTTVGVTVSAASVPPNFSLSANPSSVSVAEGASGTSTMIVTGSNSFSGTVSYSASGLPSGVTASFTGNTLTLTASSTATAGGPTTVTITGTSGSLSHTATVGVTVTAAATAPNFSLSASPSSVTVAPGSSGSTTITIAPTGGFNDSTVSFSPPGLPSGLTATFGAIGSTGTSKLTISASSSAAPMTVGVTITGTSGGLTHSAMVNVTVSSPTTTASLAAAPTSLSFRYSGGSIPASQKVTVTDPPGNSSYSASASGGSWLSVTPGSGNTPGSVMVSVNPGRMSAGTYTGSVVLSSSTATGTSVPVTLTITSVTCTDDCGGSGGGTGGGSSGSPYAQAYVYDPTFSGMVTAVWVDRLGMPTSNQSVTHDPGLVLSKNGTAPAGTMAGSTIRNYTGSLTELGYDYRSGGQCTATSPRFIVVTTDNITHVVGGCSKGAITAAPVAGWNRVRFNLAETSQTNPAITPGETVSSITLVLDVGPEAGPAAAGGLAVIDNVNINGTFVTPGSTRTGGDN